MRLTTIWTLRAMPLTERLHQTADWAAFTLAAKMPKRVRFWAFIQVGGKAMPEDAIVPEISFMDVLKGVDGGPR